MASPIGKRAMCPCCARGHLFDGECRYCGWPNNPPIEGECEVIDPKRKMLERDDDE